MIALRFQAPTGCYDLCFEPIEDTPIAVRHGGVEMTWHIHVAASGMVAGITLGAKAIWGDEFWFELRTEAPVSIRYFGDGVHARTDGVVS